MPGNSPPPRRPTLADALDGIDDARDESALRAAAERAAAAVGAEFRANTPALEVAASWAEALRRTVAASVRLVPDTAEAPWTWFVSGSVGRGEPAPGSDVETMLAIGDDVDENAKAAMLTQAADVHALLERCGISVDANGVLASRPRFCRRTASWAEGLIRWTTDPGQDRGVVMTGLMSDSTAVLTTCGLSDDAFRSLTLGAVGRSQSARQALMHDATALRAHVPSRLRTFASQSDVVDLKLACLDPAVKIARWAALAAGSDAITTLRRLDDAAAATTLDADDASSLRDCFIWLTRFRWRQRIGHVADGRRVSDTVSLSAIAPQDRATVRSIGREIVGISRKLRFLGSLG